jgi:hypothetical protein
MSRVRVTTVAMERQYVLHIVTVCTAVALVIQHAKRMRRIIQGDQKVSVLLMITIQKVTSNVQSVPRRLPNI